MDPTLLWVNMSTQVGLTVVNSPGFQREVKNACLAGAMQYGYWGHDSTWKKGTVICFLPEKAEAEKGQH